MLLDRQDRKAQHHEKSTPPVVISSKDQTSSQDSQLYHNGSPCRAFSVASSLSAGKGILESIKQLRNDLLSSLDD